MRRIGALLVLALGCQQAPSADTGLSGGGGSFTPMSSTGEASTTSGGSSTSAAAATASSTASSTGDPSSSTWSPLQDMGIPDLPPGSACNGKIDLVFVITQAGNLTDHIDVLYDSYPEILATIQDEFADFDLHVMFADPNDKWAADYACPKGMCPEEGGCPAEGYEDFPCWVLYDDDALSKCDDTLGAGITFPAGKLSSNKDCQLPEGRRFLKGDDPLFTEHFACLSHAGIGGSIDQVGWRWPGRSPSISKRAATLGSSAMTPCSSPCTCRRATTRPTTPTSGPSGCSRRRNSSRT